MNLVFVIHISIEIICVDLSVSLKMDDDYSEDELLDTQHSTLLQNASATYGKKFQRIKPPSRNEPSLEISEFHLLNKRRKEEGLIKDLASSLDKTGKHAQVSQKVKKVQKLIKPLPAPLEKPEAEKIKRTVAFNATKNLLNRWEPIVSANRVADQLSFPLNTPFFKLTSPKSFLNNPYGKTPLEKEVDSILSSLTGEKKEEDKGNAPKKTFFLNRKEILEQRRELARLRAQQSYRESKARQQNKIKSKRYHRILRRERTKKQIKEFEELMKVNPEAALKKLEELENTRAEERLTLRHRSTGQWARNRAVHAKYDKQSREVLAQQLRIGRELTQKVRASDSSDGEDVEENITLNNVEENPWMQKGADYQTFISGYRKFWDDVNKEKAKNETESSCVPPVVSDESECHIERVSDVGIVVEGVKSNSVGESVTKFGFVVSDVNKTSTERNRNSPMKRLSSDWKCSMLHEDEGSMRDDMKLGTKQGNKKTKKNTSVKEVMEKRNAKDLDDIFEEMEVALKNKAEKKILTLKSEVSTEPEPVLKKEGMIPNPKKGKKGDTASSQERKTSLTIIDETTRELGSKAVDKLSDSTRLTMDLLSKTTSASGSSTNVEIDPKKFISIDVNKPINCGIPSIAEAGDDDDDDDSAVVDNRISIAAAFTEDDVVTEFQQEKEAIIEENKPKDVDLFLPGWGDWAGNGVPEAPRRKKRRFLLKVSQHIPRKDYKKGSVIINENADDKIRPYQVSELPYPYVSVESFEASIRAPLGSTWIPETAHEKLTVPKVSTLLGAVIEPLTEDALLDESEMKKVADKENDFIPEEW